MAVLKAPNLKEVFKMLVLSRKEGERLVIGDNITVVISKVCGNRVTIGIEAPKDVMIFRSELKEEEDAAEPISKPLVSPVTKKVPSKAQATSAKRNSLKEFAGSILTIQRQVG